MKERPHILPLGDSAITIEFGNEINPEINAHVVAFAQRVRVQAWSGILDIVPTYRSVTVHPGPQQHFVEKHLLTTLTQNPHTVSPQSNRMGYRLAGPKIAQKDTAPFISDGTATGSLQVPSDGQPILLMADRQTTGGYAKIAVVISADLPLAAQLAPGDRIRFVLCTVAQDSKSLANATCPT